MKQHYKNFNEFAKDMFAPYHVVTKTDQTKHCTPETTKPYSYADDINKQLKNGLCPKCYGSKSEFIIVNTPLNICPVCKGTGKRPLGITIPYLKPAGYIIHHTLKKNRYLALAQDNKTLYWAECKSHAILFNSEITANAFLIKFTKLIEEIKE